MPNLTLLVCHTYSSPKQKRNNSLSPSSPFWPIWTMTLGGFNPNAIAATQTGHLTSFPKVSPWPALSRICHVLIISRKCFFFCWQASVVYPGLLQVTRGLLFLKQLWKMFFHSLLSLPKLCESMSCSHTMFRGSRGCMRSQPPCVTSRSRGNLQYIPIVLYLLLLFFCICCALPRVSFCGYINLINKKLF